MASYSAQIDYCIQTLKGCKSVHPYSKTVKEELLNSLNSRTLLHIQAPFKRVITAQSF